MWTNGIYVSTAAHTEREWSNSSTTSPSAVDKLCRGITCHRNAHPYTHKHSDAPCHSQTSLYFTLGHESKSDMWPSCCWRLVGAKKTQIITHHILRCHVSRGLIITCLVFRCWHTVQSLSALMVSCLFQDANCGLPYHRHTQGHSNS